MVHQLEEECSEHLNNQRQYLEHQHLKGQQEHNHCLAIQVLRALEVYLAVVCRPILSLLKVSFLSLLKPLHSQHHLCLGSKRSQQLSNLVDLYLVVLHLPQVYSVQTKVQHHLAKPNLEEVVSLVSKFSNQQQPQHSSAALRQSLQVVSLVLSLPQYSQTLKDYLVVACSGNSSNSSRSSFYKHLPSLSSIS